MPPHPPSVRASRVLIHIAKYSDQLSAHQKKKKKTFQNPSSATD